MAHIISETDIHVCVVLGKSMCKLNDSLSIIVWVII